MLDSLFDVLRDPDVRRGLLTLVVVVDVLALLAIGLSRKHALSVKVIWAVIVLLVPAVGAVAWLALGRERRAGHR